MAVDGAFNRFPAIFIGSPGREIGVLFAVLHSILCGLPIDGRLHMELCSILQCVKNPLVVYVLVAILFYPIGQRGGGLEQLPRLFFREVLKFQSQ